ncbi:nuclear transport factor 2 family protein [Brevibacterium spongiae]|uniref:Nuclear transport factor 2 family protein n=1 Tax=Brevibacterium spongiae TaxID=2909672 RepID=A0ABY5SPC3_9MICO|nr:nuclear transport factor 2 family protein [Brevibacterium spongiae]UVI35028.1 nuclear transport factor 2 family protein [Brevibacterium spongiae]
MSTSLHTLITDNLAAVTAKDVEAAVSAFASHGVLIDPHYPRPRMAGHTEIREGFQWVFAGMRELNFTIDSWLFSEDGTSAAVEVSSRHVLAGGRVLEFGQCFVVDTADGRVTRWQAYEPYGPGGLGGITLGFGRLKFRRARRR